MQLFPFVLSPVHIWNRTCEGKLENVANATKYTANVTHGVVFKNLLHCVFDSCHTVLGVLTCTKVYVLKHVPHLYKKRW